MQSIVRVGLLLLCGMMLTACATTRQTETTPDRIACTAFEQGTFSASGDTPETVAWIRTHNAKWRAVCEPSADL